MFVVALKGSNLFILIYQLQSGFGIKSGICLLIVPVPVHCFSLTFIAKVDKGNASKEENIKKIISDKVKNNIGHPESFISRQGFKLLRFDNVMQKKVTQIVIDETNCVVQWADGFREKFREIKLLRSVFPSAKMLALTATATIKMSEEITAHLALKTPAITAAPKDRSNIKMKVSRKSKL